MLLGGIQEHQKIIGMKVLTLISPSLGINSPREHTTPEPGVA
jgi:hypothetical protein